MPRKTRTRRRRSARKYSAWNNRELLEQSTKLLLRGEHARALAILSVAAAEHPDNAAVVTRHGDALYLSGRVAEAREAYRRACVLDETEFQAWYGRGCAEFAFEAYASAIVCLRRGLALKPRDNDARLYLGRSLFYMGEVDPAIEELLLVAESEDAGARREALRQIAVIVPGSPARGNAKILNARRKWAGVEEKIERPRKAFPSLRRSSGKRLRIGYVSSFFNSRNWMKPVWGTINEHDRSAFEIHLFLDGESPAADSGYRQHPDDRIHLIGLLSNETAAERIRAAGIDVLVDLNGYSAVKRLGIFMRKPAPILAGWFSMYATTGIRAFDYIVGDAWVIPPEEERFCSERVLRVSGSYMAFSVLYPVPEVERAPCVREGRITFGCLAPQYKLTNDVISAWGEILRGARQARLLLKNSAMDDPANQAALFKRFARIGVERERVTVEGGAEHFEFLKTYNRVDIALDTFPYNGGTTTEEALWQGVPVLAFNGDRWVGRISRSILEESGLGDWIVESPEAYIQRAIALANSPGTTTMLTAIRGRMREQLLASPVCDSARLCRELERHYLTIGTLSGANAHKQRA
jgi:protein O-GlcNAc transferase